MTATEPKRPTLFALGNDWLALSDLLDETGGEITEATAPALDAIFADMEAATGDKLEGYYRLVRRRETEAAAARAEAEQYAKMAQVAENGVKALKGRIRLFMEMTGQAKLKTASGVSIRLVANGGKAPLVKAGSIDLATVPDAMKRVRVELDEDAVRTALEAGETLAFAQLGTRGSHVRLG